MVGTANPPRVAKVSRWMARLCAFLVVTVPLANAAIVFGDPEQAIANNDLARFGITAIDGPDQYTVFAISTLFSLPLLWGLLQLRRLFVCYSRGEIFSRAAARYLSRFALALLLGAVATVLERTAMVAALTMHNPPGSRSLIVALGSPEIATAFVGVIFMIIAWVLGEAAAVAEDHRGFV